VEREKITGKKENDGTASVKYPSKELFSVAGINYFWHFFGGGPAGWSCTGRVWRNRAQNQLVGCFW